MQAGQALQGLARLLPTFCTFADEILVLRPASWKQKPETQG